MSSSLSNLIGPAYNFLTTVLFETVFPKETEVLSIYAVIPKRYLSFAAFSLSASASYSLAILMQLLQKHASTE
jgi:hypothetical protein